MQRVYDYKLEVNSLISLLQDKDNLVVLDSQTTDRSLSRYSIISYNPDQTIRYTANNQLLINGEQIDCEPLALIDDLLVENSNQNNLPFSGGFIGSINYHMLEDIYSLNLDNKSALPKINGGIYNQAIIIDHQAEETIIFNNKGDLSELEALISRVTTGKQINSRPTNEKKKQRMLTTTDQYKTAVNRVKDYIRSGDVYEINYTTGYQVTTEKTSIELFNRLSETNPAPFASLLKFNDYQVISSSPELFYTSDGSKIATQPMKGTIARGQTTEQDKSNLMQLKNSDKDKSELIMIVDLMRNDISKVCLPDSVKVENQFMIKPYPTVYQQVTDVIGELQPEVGFKQIFTSLFPSGSITGAPKLRSIEVIDELENRPRGTYTGAIGFYSFNRKSTFNVAIRTIDLVDQIATVNVGGAIVWDSQTASEYQECEIKAKALLAVLNE